MSRFVYLTPNGEIGTLEDPRLDIIIERHRIVLPPPVSCAPGDAVAAMASDSSLAGVVIEMASGCPSPRQIRLLGRVLRRGRRAWLWWPEEGAVETVTAERIRSYRRHARLMTAHRRVYAPLARLLAIPRRLQWVLRDVPKRRLPIWAVKRAARTGPALRLRRRLGDPRLGPPIEPETPVSGPSTMRHAQRLAAIRALRQRAKPVPFPSFPQMPAADCRIPGRGIYLRTDFWSPIVSGGSYGHTCYVAKELAAVTESFVAYVANPFPMLDEIGVPQVVMPRPFEQGDEDNIANATPYYLDLLRPVFEEQRPAYIYERLCVGNYAGATLSAEFQVPYVVEYNGSEISMRRSFEGTGYVNEAEYLEAEALAFEQATLISVVSTVIRQGLIERGIDPAKIIVNPNGVDLDAYAPVSESARTAIRVELGFGADDRVVGFTGTFGGWHGIDVLSDAIPRICQAARRARFLLIGDGHFKHLVDAAVAEHGLGARVVSTGRVPQADGARLLQACDIYVSPHSRHMVDSKFFGSPTKIFEYMSLGGGIVASDLEQIGDVLSPAFTPRDASRGAAPLDERAVLCPPGDVDAFVLAVVALVDNPALCGALGRNARTAARDHYSWTRHVAKLWQFVAGTAATDMTPDLRRKGRAPHAGVSVAATEPRRTMVREGSAVDLRTAPVSTSRQRSEQWFLELERDRYQQFAPWIPETMDFFGLQGKEVLEIGGGGSTDLPQFAVNGARVTRVDSSPDHLKLVKEHFSARGLSGRFVVQDAGCLIFDDRTFDLVYSLGFIHHADNSQQIVREMFRVLKPGGRAVAMVYAENSWRYWRDLVWRIGIDVGQLRKYSMSEILSRAVEDGDNAGGRPPVKVYTRERLQALFEDFVEVDLVQRQIDRAGAPRLVRSLPSSAMESLMGWHLIVTARKPAVARQQ